MQFKIHSKMIVLLTICLLITNFAKKNESFTKSNRDKNSIIINKISELLIENYVFKDVAKKCGEYLEKQRAAGKYNNLADKLELAQKLTADLQSISKDKHMRVRLPVNRNQANIGRGDYGFGETKVFDGNIGYVKMYNFNYSPEAQKTAIEAMQKVSNSNAVIFDMRENGGGSPESVRLICSYFFDKPTHLNSLYWRRNNFTQEFWTLDKVEGKKMAKIPVFILTSGFTFSGAEEFTYNFQTQKRGIVVGEVTGGGANPGGSFQINDEMAIFIPTGRAINPITGTNWEGVGVIPDIKVPASEALNNAIQKAKEIVNKK